MGQGVFDSALHREVEFYNRVDGNDPTNSAFILLILAAAGLEADSVLRTYATVSALLAASNNEVTNTNYVRKTITDAELNAYSVDTTNHTITLSIPTPQSYTSIGTGDSWRKAVIAYDNDTTGGTDANLIPVFFYDILKDGVALVPNGNNINLGFDEGIFIAN